jgi:hypothetical protein
MQRSKTLFFLLVIALVLIAGCTQSIPVPVPRPDRTVAAPTPTQPPAVVSTPPAPVPTATTSKPVETVTMVHYVVPDKAWKDSVHHFVFTAPEAWNITTVQMDLPEGSQGLEFQTSLVPSDIFYIRSFPISVNQDQSYRNMFRTWDPKPSESVVTYNNIDYDRFESTSKGKTHIGYVARKISANDIGFSNVLVFTANTSQPFEKEDFEKVVASFAYFTSEEAATVQGEEIARLRW